MVYHLYMVKHFTSGMTTICVFVVTFLGGYYSIAYAVAQFKAVSLINAKRPLLSTLLSVLQSRVF